jgi:hypothetical protein
MSKQLNDSQEALIRKADLFREVFESPRGKRAMAMLRDEFDPVDIFDPDTHTTAFRLGQREVITYITSLLEYDRVIET